jgi:hypothetical protein
MNFLIANYSGLPPMKVRGQTNLDLSFTVKSGNKEPLNEGHLSL